MVDQLYPTTRTFTSKVPGKWSMTISARGTARITLGNGSQITVCNCATPQQAIRKARAIVQGGRHAA